MSAEAGGQSRHASLSNGRTLRVEQQGQQEELLSQLLLLFVLARAGPGRARQGTASTCEAGQGVGAYR
eukprot:12910256-Prorocentrum_lima.AAC.1